VDRAKERLGLAAAAALYQAQGGMLPSGFCLRPTIVSWRTTRDDLELLAAEVVRIGDELSA
jgi:hypothetical protein